MAKVTETNQWLTKAKDALEDATILSGYKKSFGPINRLYYCAFYCAKGFLVTHGEKHKRHASVIRNFGKIIIQERKIPKKYGRFLNKMFDLRHRSDYSTTAEKILRKEMSGLIRTGTKFLSEVEKYTCSQSKIGKAKTIPK